MCPRGADYRGGTRDTSLTVMPRFAQTRETPDWADPGSLMEYGFDFGFGTWSSESGFEWGTGGGLLPPIIDVLRRPAPVPPVISEIPTEWPEWSLEPILETRPGEIPDPYPGTEAAGTVDPGAIIGPYQGADTPEQLEEDEPMAHDWGHLGRQLLEGIGGQVFGTTPTGMAPPFEMTGGVPYTGGTGTTRAAAAAGADCDGMAWSGGTPPKGYKVVNYCGRGVLRKVRRRRRRRLLTASDSRDIATIVGLVGKGQMASALINRR